LTLLVGRQEGHPACKKTELWGAGMVISLEQDADLHMAQLMPLPLTVSCFSKIQIGFTFLVPAHPGSLGKGPLNGCVCVRVLLVFFQTSAVLPVKPVKKYRRWFHQIPETGIGFANEADGFTDTGTKTHFSFDKRITLSVPKEFSPKCFLCAH